MAELTQELADAKAKLEAAGLSVIEKIEKVEALPSGPCLAFRAWEKARCAAVMTVVSTWNLAACGAKLLKGVRTLLFFGVMGATALLAEVQGLNIAGILSRVTGLQIQAEDVIMFMSAAGVGLRLVTNSPMFTRWKQAARGDGVAPGIGSGDVDEPVAPTSPTEPVAPTEPVSTEVKL